MTTLGALLLNPPLVGGSRTNRQLQIAAHLLGCDKIEIANLFADATPDMTGINWIGRFSDGWEAAQPRLQHVIATSDHLLAGWGVGGLAGLAAKHQRAQLGYIRTCAIESGKDEIWTLNGQPRHPSRWHQYVSDRHGRATGESFSERMAMVLSSVAIATLCPISDRD